MKPVKRVKYPIVSRGFENKDPLRRGDLIKKRKQETKIFRSCELTLNLRIDQRIGLCFNVQMFSENRQEKKAEGKPMSALNISPLDILGRSSSIGWGNFSNPGVESG